MSGDEEDKHHGNQLIIAHAVAIGFSMDEFGDEAWPGFMPDALEFLRQHSLNRAKLHQAAQHIEYVRCRGQAMQDGIKLVSNLAREPQQVIDHQ